MLCTQTSSETLYSLPRHDCFHYNARKGCDMELFPATRESYTSLTHASLRQLVVYTPQETLRQCAFRFFGLRIFPTNNFWHKQTLNVLSVNSFSKQALHYLARKWYGKGHTTKKVSSRLLYCSGEWREFAEDRKEQFLDVIQTSLGRPEVC